MCVVAGGWLLAQLRRAVPAPVLERKGTLEMTASSSLGDTGDTGIPGGKWRIRLWGQTQALKAVLALN